MKSLSIIPSQETVALTDRQEPVIQAPDEVKLQVLEVGICGTDHEEIHGAHAQLPQGENKLVIGHEMLGRIIEVGSKVTTLKVGDLATISVRRGCSDKGCSACQMDRPDMCSTGNCLERGIKGLDGYQAEFVTDREAFVIKLPSFMRSYGVLSEPASVVEKGIDAACRIQRGRGVPNWEHPSDCLQGKRVFVAGLGSIGFIAAIFFKLYGADVTGYDIVTEDFLRAHLLKEIDGVYVSGKKIIPSQLASSLGTFDLIFEAVGKAHLSIDLFPVLAPNGICILTGVTRSKHMRVDVGALMNQFVLKNQVLLGTVNADTKHWESAVSNLEKANKVFHGIMEKLITHRIPYQEYQKAFLEDGNEAIKKTIVWEH